MKSVTINCTPGYQPSRGTGAFKAEHGLDMWVSGVWRQRLSAAPATFRVQTVITDAPLAMSASSFERSP